MLFQSPFLIIGSSQYFFPVCKGTQPDTSDISDSTVLYVSKHAIYCKKEEARQGTKLLPKLWEEGYGTIGSVCNRF